MTIADNDWEEDDDYEAWAREADIMACSELPGIVDKLRRGKRINAIDYINLSVALGVVREWVAKAKGRRG